MKGIEPSYAAWEAAVLPLNYTRTGFLKHNYHIKKGGDCQVKAVCKDEEKSASANGRAFLLSSMMKVCRWEDEVTTVFEFDVFVAWGDALIGRTDDAAVLSKLFQTVRAPTTDT